jgi:hypothetical protein
LNINRSVRLRKSAEVFLLLVLGGLIAWLAIEAWFDPLRFTVLAGDDLANLEPSSKSYGESIAFLASYLKFRPVASFAQWSVTHWTNGDARGMAAVAIAIHSVNALLFFVLTHRILRLTQAISLGLTVIAILNRFTANLISPSGAIAEGIGVTVLLCIVAAALRFLERPTVRRAALLTFLFLLILHIHERFLVLVCPLLLVAVGAWTRSRFSALLVGLGAIASCLANFGIKKFWLGTPILIGTTTRPLEFDFAQIWFFIWHGALNLFGIHSGPSYLSLEDFSESPLWIRSVSVAAAALTCILVAKIIGDAVLAPPGEKNTVLQRLLFFFSTTGVLLLSASITFRQEYRWLYSPYLVFLCLLASGVSRRARPGATSFALVTCLISLSVVREAYLVQRLPNLFYFPVQQVASNLFYTLQHVSGIREKEAVLIRGDVPTYDWAFLGNTFSRTYGLPPLEFAGGPPVVEEVGPMKVVVDYHPSDNTFTQAQAQSLAPGKGHMMEFAVLEQKAATLPSDPRLSTPTQTQLFVASKNGANCIVAVSPLEVTVQPPANAKTLRVCVSHFYSLGDGVNLDVAALSATGLTTLLERELPPLPNDDYPVWRKYELTLPPGIEGVELHVYSKSGDPTADWVAVRDFSFE